MSIFPVLRYADADAALDFLTSAFGFRTGPVDRAGDGTVTHAEVVGPGGGIVMIGTRADPPAPFDTGPATLYLAVDDPDTLHDRAVAAGARVVYPLVDQPYGSREFGVADPEGTIWTFGTYRPAAPADAADTTNGAAQAADRGGVLDLMFGFFPAQVVRTVAELGVADALAAGPRTAAALATTTGTDPAALGRLLRAAGGLGLVEDRGEAGVALTADGDLLRRGAPGSVGSVAMLFCGEQTWRSWGELPTSVRTGEPSFERIAGRSAFAFMAQDPVLAAVFTEAMAEGTRAAAPGVVAACDLTGVTTLADLGGGNGTLLAALLASAPELRGVLFDSADGLGDAAKVLADAGVAQRCELVAGDFFTAVPTCDAYLLKSVLHDWSDADCLRILAAVRAAAPAHGTLFVVEPLLPSDPAGLRAAGRMLMSDLNMLVCTGGRERTRDEFADLLDRGGFRLTGVEPCSGPTGYSVLRAVPA